MSFRCEVQVNEGGQGCPRLQQWQLKQRSPMQIQEQFSQ